MIAALWASTILLWVVVLVLAGMVFALTRQIGVLYERVAPAGALTIGHGLHNGEAAPVVRAPRLGGETEMVGAPSADGRATLVFFLSPTCPVCKTLLPVLRSLARDEAAALRVLLASDGPREEHEAFVHSERLDAFPYVLSTQLGMTWQVAKLPYGVLVDAAGVVRAHGIVNSREHLESLLEANERGIATIQEYVAQSAAADEPPIDSIRSHRAPGHTTVAHDGAAPAHESDVSAHGRAHH